MDIHKMKRLHCSVCNYKEYGLSQTLKKHVSKHIFNVPMYQCRICKRQFKDKLGLLRHNQKRHENSKTDRIYTYNNSHVCALCGKRFTKKPACVDHVVRHDSMLHKCGLCGWTFGTLYLFHVHCSFWHSRSRQGKRKKANCSRYQSSVKKNKKCFQKVDNTRSQSRNSGHQSKAPDENFLDSLDFTDNQKYYCCPFHSCNVIYKDIHKFRRHIYTRHGKYIYPIGKCRQYMIDKSILPPDVEPNMKKSSTIIKKHVAKPAEAIMRKPDKIREVPSKVVTQAPRNSGKMSKVESKRTTKCFNRDPGAILPSATELRQSGPNLPQSSAAPEPEKETTENTGPLEPIVIDLTSDVESDTDSIEMRSKTKLNETSPMQSNVKIMEYSKPSSRKGDSDTKYLCPFTKCNMTLNGYAQYTSHMRSEHNITRTCRACSRYFSSDESLSSHLHIHHRMRYLCPHENCRHMYGTLLALQGHCYNRHRKRISLNQLRKNEIQIDETFKRNTEKTYSEGTNTSKKCSVPSNCVQNVKGHLQVHSPCWEYKGLQCGLAYPGLSDVTGLHSLDLSDSEKLSFEVNIRLELQKSTTKDTENQTFFQTTGSVNSKEPKTAAPESDPEPKSTGGDPAPGRSEINTESVVQSGEPDVIIIHSDSDSESAESDTKIIHKGTNGPTSSKETLNGILPKNDKLRQKLHQRSNLTMRQCVVCWRQFKDSRGLAIHRKRAHGSHKRKVDSFECNLCGRTFVNEVYYEKHTLHHGSLVHECSRCGWRFSTAYQVKVHQALWHHNEIANYSDGREAGSGSGTRNAKKIVDRKRHDKDASNTPPKLNLNFMQRNKSDVELANERIEQQNDVLTNKVCKICGRNFRSEHRLLDHMVNHDILKYTCPQSDCGQKYQNLANLRSHCFSRHNNRMRRSDLLKNHGSFPENHTLGTLGEGPTQTAKRNASMECPICTRNLLPTLYEKHVTNHSSMRYRCTSSKCGWMFEDFGPLQAHCKSHHQTLIKKGRDENRFLVEYYNDHVQVIASHEGRKFASHTRVAHESRNHTCKLCGLYFQANPELYEHYEKHYDGKMKYVCQHGCGHMYEKLAELRVHYYRKHKKRIRIRGSSKYVIPELKQSAHAEQYTVTKQCPINSIQSANITVNDAEVSRSTGYCPVANVQPISIPEQCSITINEPISISKQSSATNTKPISVTEQCSVTSTEPISVIEQCSVTSTEPMRISKQSSTTNTEPISITEQCSVTSTEPIGVTEQCVLTSTEPISITEQSSATSTEPTSITGSRKRKDLSLVFRITRKKNGHVIRRPFRRWTLTCPICSRHLHKSNLNRHVQNHHKMNFKCLQSDCGWMFQSFSALSGHVSYKHNKTITLDENGGSWLWIGGDISKLRRPREKPRGRHGERPSLSQEHAMDCQQSGPINNKTDESTNCERMSPTRQNTGHLDTLNIKMGRNIDDANPKNDGSLLWNDTEGEPKPGRQSLLNIRETDSLKHASNSKEQDSRNFEQMLPVHSTPMSTGHLEPLPYHVSLQSTVGGLELYGPPSQDQHCMLHRQPSPKDNLERPVLDVTSVDNDIPQSVSGNCSTQSIVNTTKDSPSCELRSIPFSKSSYLEKHMPKCVENNRTYTPNAATSSLSKSNSTESRAKSADTSNCHVISWPNQGESEATEDILNLFLVSEQSDTTMVQPTLGPKEQITTTRQSDVELGESSGATTEIDTTVAESQADVIDLTADDVEEPNTDVVTDNQPYQGKQVKLRPGCEKQFLDHFRSFVTERSKLTKFDSRICFICTRKFDSASECRIHFQRHNYMEHKCVYVQCGWMFEEYRMLQCHYRRQHMIS